MSLHGDIRLMPLNDVFQWLGLKKKTGVLKIEAEMVRQQFYLDRGMIVTALSPRYYTTDSEENVRYLLADSLRQTSGLYFFTEGPLPEELAQVSLRLGIGKLLAEIAQPTEAGLAQSASASDSVSSGTPFRAAEFLRLAVVDRLMLNNYEVPVLPTVVKKVIEITRTDDYSIYQLSNVIMAEQVLAARILRYANSPLYAGEREVDSIRNAIQRLGGATVINLVMAVALQSTQRGRSIFLKERNQIWQHSLASALMARAIARTLRTDAEMAFLCGLMMDFGKIILLSLIEEIMKKDARVQRTPVGIVTEMLEAYHCQSGGVAAEKWLLPAPVRETVAFHHHPSLSPEYSAFAAIAGLSDVLVTRERPSATEVEVEPDASQLVLLPAAEMLGLSVTQMNTIIGHRAECLKMAEEFLRH